MSSNSLKWIDIMKGIGIISVVAGHIFIGPVKNFIYLFHMPLFFFIAGYLFKREENVISFFQKKFISYIIPYYTFLLIFYFLFKSDDSVALNLFETIRLLIGRPHGIEGGYLSVFWFIPCLFFTQQLSNYIVLKFPRIKQYMIFSIILVLSYLYSMFFNWLIIPWDLHVVLGALPIFFIGYLYKIKKVEFSNFILIPLLLCVILLFLTIEDISYNMQSGDYGIPVISLFSCITIIIFIRYISIILEQVSFISVILIELGKASMIIMYMHQPIQIILDKFLFKVPIYKFLSSILLSYLFYIIFKQWTITRAIFLGNRVDFYKIKNKIIKY